MRRKRFSGSESTMILENVHFSSSHQGGAF
jgi:hypothetical protein